MSEWLGLGILEIAGLLLIYFLGGLVKGGSGFGLPLITISVLPLIVPIDVALAVNAVVMPIVNIFQYSASGMARETFRRFWPVVAGLVLGVPVGALFVHAIAPETLTISLGAFVMAFALLTALSPRIQVPPRFERQAGGVTGVLAGIVGALTTANGPVFVIYLVGVGVERRAMVATLGLFFLVAGILVAGSFWTIGILDARRVLIAAICIGPILAGMWVGNAIGERLPQAVFRRIVLLLLFLLGANMLVRTALT
ncbi:sulfite exporter TauE/SafE family protein [Afifella sp. IM 167]|uniref:sulfite exporter TauE/SafE family protein n=1 Tax=Afifella sp. IM 167 TaxID=2033586 RepID=UPI001CCDB4CF